jgi:hypothetical protein
MLAQRSVDISIDILFSHENQLIHIDRGDNRMGLAIDRICGVEWRCQRLCHALVGARMLDIAFDIAISLGKTRNKCLKEGTIGWCPDLSVFPGHLAMSTPMSSSGRGHNA